MLQHSGFALLLGCASWLDGPSGPVPAALASREALLVGLLYCRECSSFRRVLRLNGAREME